MRKTFLIAATLLLALSATARADVVAVPVPPVDAPPPPPAVMLPKKGQTMSEVVKHYGQPVKKYAAVGGGSPKTPPITRWDYENYSVFFENSHVIDDVVPGAPPEVHHVEELKPAVQ